MAQCGNCHQPFTGTPWTYDHGTGLRVHVDCDETERLLEIKIANLDAASAPAPKRRVVKRRQYPPVTAMPDKLRQRMRQLCAATTNDGKPCKNKPMRGSIYCGPHHDQELRQTPTNAKQGGSRGRRRGRMR